MQTAPAPGGVGGNAGFHDQLIARGHAPRQAKLLAGLHDLCADECDRRLELLLDELEQQLFRSADQARSNEVQRALLEAQRRVHERRAQLKPAFFKPLREALLALTERPVTQVEEKVSALQFSELSLVDTQAMDETVLLKEMATRSETRNNLALFLLGQRMGVVARAPAFPAEDLVFGPRRLCQILHEAVACFDFDAERRGLVYQQFDRSVLQGLTPFYEALNNYLIEQGVLPHLTYVAPRSTRQRPPRPPASPAARDGQGEDKSPTGDDIPPGGTAALPQGVPDMGAIPSRAGGPAQAFAGPGPAVRAAAQPRDGVLPMPAAAASQPRAPLPPGIFPPLQGTSDTPTATADMTMPPPVMPGARMAAPMREEHASLPWNQMVGSTDDTGNEVELFDTLRHLLAGRRGLLDRLKPATSAAPLVSSDQLQGSLGMLQQRFNARGEAAEAMPFAQIKRELMAQLQQQHPGQAAPQLTPEQGDTVDLVGMLFEQIAQEVRPQSTGGHLLARLQLPLLRVAIKDQGFFTDRNHPARRMLEIVAETSAYWSNEEDVDRELIQKMNLLVRRANEDTSAAPELFDDLASGLTEHLNTQQRRAEIAERRHVEAARGREKLEIARLQAEEAIEGLMADKAVPRFLGTLLEEVWIDVLALALLRGGEQAPAFQEYLGVAGQLVDAALPSAQGGKPISTSAAADIRTRIRTALGQIGYGDVDATDIAERLLAACRATAAAPVAREGDTAAQPPAPVAELTAKLRSRDDRLGQDVRKQKTRIGVQKAERSAPLSEEEKVWHDRLKRLPYGTWFEFTINQQGDRARRRMSWYSNVTDHCMFVNLRGQRAGDYTLSWLARELNRGNVSLVEARRGSIVDRAWKAILTTLRSFARAGSDAAPVPVAG